MRLLVKVEKREGVSGALYVSSSLDVFSPQMNSTDIPALV